MNLNQWLCLNFFLFTTALGLTRLTKNYLNNPKNKQLLGFQMKTYQLHSWFLQLFNWAYQFFRSSSSALHYLKHLFILSEGILALEQVGQSQMISTFPVGSDQTGESGLWVVRNVSYTHDPKALKNKCSDLIYSFQFLLSIINKSPDCTRLNKKFNWIISIC